MDFSLSLSLGCPKQKADEIYANFLSRVKQGLRASFDTLLDWSRILSLKDTPYMNEMVAHHLHVSICICFLFVYLV